MHVLYHATLREINVRNNDILIKLGIVPIEEKIQKNCIQ